LLVNQVAHLLRMNRGDVDRLLTRRQGRRPAARGVPNTSEEETCAPPADEEQAAWVRVLEVLLGDAENAPIPDPFPDSQRIADSRDRRVAETVIGLVRDQGSFALPDVLARCRDSADAARVEVLARRGAARGNFERTLDVALERLRRAERDAATGTDSAPLRGGELLDSRESKDRLVAFSEQVREHRHFVPRGRRRARAVTDVPTEGSEGALTTEES
jgi:hypothetical protein